MLRHYLEVKDAHRDAVLLYRMGDFFEIFFDDAVDVAPLVGLTLTARHKGTANEVPMCGVPHHAIDGYIGKLLRAGRKVAICDQVEDPKQAKGLVKREVTRVITPGTLSEPDLLEGKEPNLLAGIVWRSGRGGAVESGDGAAAYLDVSTGRFEVREWADVGEALEDLAVTRPREVVHASEPLPATVSAWIDREVACVTPHEGDRLFDRRRAADLLCQQFEAASLRGFGLEAGTAAVEAAALALAYAQDNQRSELGHIRGLAMRTLGDTAVLDATTLANLEVFRNQREQTRAATLLSVLDRTVTAPGGRTLRDWLRRPLKDPQRIGVRHDAVEELISESALREAIRGRLAQVGDLERLLTRAVLGTLSPREAAVLRDALMQVPAILDTLAQCRSEALVSVADVDPRAELASELERVLAESPPARITDGGIIAEGVDHDLDRFRSLAQGSKQHILALEAREREATGISSLKVRYNKVFGYYLEVTKANQHLVPDHYIRKQTLVNAERYIIPEVKELEEQILSAEERQLALEERHYIHLRTQIAADGEGLRALAEALARLDTLAAFAEVAARNRYCRPRMAALGSAIQIDEGRHPVVEVTTTEDFVPNGCALDNEDAQLVILTGPNMGGKSTYLRQVALIVLMAQAGSFVPADAAEIGTVDRIFTRVGASDDLARGESTFMVEMIETANILHHATAESLVILDEVGRGTATFDGLSLAWAIVEHLHEHKRPKTLFATHYHELTELAHVLSGVVNRTMSVKEWQDQIVFLRRVIAGRADKSYGIHVARLAGLPQTVVERAGEVLDNLEAQAYDPKGKPRLAQGASAPPEFTRDDDQMSLFIPSDPIETAGVGDLLRDADLDDMTPLAALNFLHNLQKRLAD